VRYEELEDIERERGKNKRIRKRGKQDEQIFSK
jgi:hypothetical protein